MAPKKLDMRVNRPTEKERRVEDVDKLNTTKSWRDRDDGREAELLRVFGPQHSFGITLLSNVKCLEDFDAENNHRFVDDGASSVEALKVMKKDWLADKELMPEHYFKDLGVDLSIDPCVQQWDPQLVEVFTFGLSIVVHEYADASLEMRKVHQAQVHDEQNNKYRITGLVVMSEVGKLALDRAGGNREDAIRWLLKYHGVGSRSSAARWIELALGLAGEDGAAVIENLRQSPIIPARYVLDNPYLLGRGVDARHKLSVGASICAFEHLRDELRGKLGDTGTRGKEPDSTVDKFRKWHCALLKVVEVWHQMCLRKFGRTARESQSLLRVVQRLQTLPGLQAVEACASSRTPLHGHSDNNPGIQECRSLWQQFEQVLSGGPAPSVLGASASLADSCAPTVSLEELAANLAFAGEHETKSKGLGEEDCQPQQHFHTLVIHLTP